MSGYAAVRSCFNNSNIVVLRNDGDGALLVRDAQRRIQVILCCQENTLPRLIVPAWNSSSLLLFELRVNDVKYETGPLVLEIGDELQLTLPGAWEDEEGRKFRVEYIDEEKKKEEESKEKKKNKEAKENEEKEEDKDEVSEEKVFMSFGGLKESKETNAWSEFVKYRIEKLEEIFSSFLNFTSSLPSYPTNNTSANAEEIII